LRTLPEGRDNGIDTGEVVEELPFPEISTFDCERPALLTYLLLIIIPAILLPEWASYSLHPQLMHVLHKKGFRRPTPIQEAVIPVTAKGRDVIGVAQTVRFVLPLPVKRLYLNLLCQGSVKTLAYGLPILHYLLSQPRPHPNKRRPVRALILAPTRELALQVSSHLNECLTPVQKDDERPQTSKETTKGKKAQEKSKARGKEKADDSYTSLAKKPPPHVSVAAIVGGMSSQKQRRILDRGVDVLVATPGRLWDIMEDVGIGVSIYGVISLTFFLG
jgi:ATP-dependent RNA helicase DDX24/MAK5